MTICFKLGGASVDGVGALPTLLEFRRLVGGSARLAVQPELRRRTVLMVGERQGCTGRPAVPFQLSGRRHARRDRLASTRLKLPYTVSVDKAYQSFRSKLRPYSEDQKSTSLGGGGFA